MRHTGDRMIGRSKTLLDEMTSGSVQANEVVQRAIMKMAAGSGSNQSESNKKSKGNRIH